MLFNDNEYAADTTTSTPTNTTAITTFNATTHNHNNFLSLIDLDLFRFLVKR